LTVTLVPEAGEFREGFKSLYDLVQLHREEEYSKDGDMRLRHLSGQSMSAFSLEMNGESND